MKHYTLEEKYLLMEKSQSMNITLNGIKASIKGARLKFGFIVSNNQSVEFSWNAIDRIISKDGKFYLCNSDLDW